MLRLDEKSSVETSAESNLVYWMTLVDEQFRKKDFGRARDYILQGLAKFPYHPLLLDRLFIVDRRWNSPIACSKLRLAIPNESDFPFLQQCYAN